MSNIINEINEMIDEMNDKCKYKEEKWTVEDINNGKDYCYDDFFTYAAIHVRNIQKLLNY